MEVEGEVTMPLILAAQMTTTTTITTITTAVAVAVVAAVVIIHLWATATAVATAVGMIYTDIRMHTPTPPIRTRDIGGKPPIR